MEEHIKNILAHDYAEITAFNELLDKEIAEMRDKKSKGYTDEDINASKKSLRNAGILDENDNLAEYYRFG